MSLYTKGATGWSRADAADLDRKLRDGDGIHWAGDPRLDLREGVIESQKYQYVPDLKRHVQAGEIIARRWEVWRVCEDGVERLLAHWLPVEFDRILFDIAMMRMDSPAHVDVVDQIEAANTENEKKVWTPYRESQLTMLDHLVRLKVEREEGKHIFHQVGGSDEKPDRNLATSNLDT